MYYMMERLSRDKEQFDVDVQNEYRDYYTDFTEKYGFLHRLNIVHFCLENLQLIIRI